MSRFVVSRLGVAALLALALAACASSEVPATDAAPDAAAIDATAADAAVDAAIDAAADAAVDAAIDGPGGPDACVPTTELCNGRDDNCDLVIDEDFPTVGQACTVGMGACARTGMWMCNAAGTGVVCSASAGQPTAETCNGVDDNCDGTTDEGFGLGTACDGTDADLCTEGMIVCNASGGTTCSDTTGDTVEVCNGADDDCDTRTDEGWNVGMGCDGADTDACVEGTIVCNGSGGTTCSDNTSSTVETCNGLDDDCQGGVDNGFPVGVTCSVGVGACNRTGTNVCNAAGTGVQCSATAGSPAAEICGDGIDQDCNGADVACPTNDGPTGAVNISAGGVFTVDLTAARNDQDFTGTSCGSTGGRDVYYTFTLPAAETIYLDTYGSNFDTTLRVFAGSCTALGALQSCFDDSCSILQSQGALPLAAGTYCVVADQYSSAQTLGSLTLTFTRGGRTGTALPAVGPVTSTSCSGTNGSTGTCQSNSTAQDSSFYFLACPAQTRTLAASVCTGTSFDSVLYLRKAGAATDVACNDDTTSCGSGLQSSFTGAAAVGPGLFWVIVDGYLANCGAYTLTYTLN